MIQTGDIICAVHSIQEDIAYLYGYGTYKGVSKVTDIVIGCGDIDLDSGINIHDLECMYGLPEVIDLQLKGKRIVLIDPIQVRRSHTAELSMPN